MPDYIYSEWARVQIREHPVLVDVNRNVNRGDVLHVVLEGRLGETMAGIFAGFVEHSGQVQVELCAGSAPPICIDPLNVVKLSVSRGGIIGFSNDYRSRDGQGAPKDGPSI